MKPSRPAFLAPLLAVMLVCCDRSNTDADDMTQTMILSDIVQQQFAKAPGYVEISYEQGKGEVVFVKEDRAYFKSEENIGTMQEVAAREAFGAIPEMERFTIRIPFEGQIWSRTTRRDHYVTAVGAPHSSTE